MATATTLAPAKVNLALFVGPRRDDGFHDLATIFQAISLSDEVEVQFSPLRHPPDGVDPGHEAIAIDLVVDGPDLGPIEENLAWRAAVVFLRETGTTGHVSIHLSKMIPAGAGLGGGSSDAAAVLRCLAALTGFSDARALGAMAARLGSDVPFFLCASPTAIGRGRGERVEAIPALPSRPLAVALPPVHVATGPAYEHLSTSRTGQASVSLPELDVDVSWTDLLEGLAANDFQATVATAHPPVASSLEAMQSAGARLAMLSGSGAASFGLFDESVDADEVDRLCAEMSSSLKWPVVSCTTLTQMPDIDLA